MGGKGKKNKQKQPQVVQEVPVPKPEPVQKQEEPKADIKEVKEKVKQMQEGQAKLEKQAQILQKKDEEEKLKEEPKKEEKEEKPEPKPEVAKKVEESKIQDHGDEMMAMDPMSASYGNVGWGAQTQKKQEEDIELQSRLQAVLSMSQKLQQQGGRMDPKQRKLIERQIKLLKPHSFWDSQPVRNMKHRNPTSKDGKLENKQVKDVKQEAYPLPDGFEWCTVDLNNDDDAQSLYTLLKEHYVEDSEGIFRFEYSVDLIKWVLLTPNYNIDWHVGLRSSKTKKLLGFISGTPCKVQVNQNAVKMAEINFLCVNKKLRTKRMTPMLIQEVTRRVNLTGIWSAIYTSGDTFPTPFTEANYFHRNLNPKKNIETGFSALGTTETMAKYMKKMKLHDNKDINIVGEPRLMISKDLPQVFALYKKQMEKMKVSFKFNQQELGHHLLPRDGIIYTIVFEDVAEKKITDFVSFYNLPSQILKQQGHNHSMMNVAYLYYYGNTVNNLTEMMKHVLLFAKEQVPDGTRFDVFNCLNIMDNASFLVDLKFGVGDGILNYYMYNYILGGDVGQMRAAQLGTVLV